MRTPLLAGLLAVLVPACVAGEISGIGDDDVGSNTGDDTGGGSGSDGSGSDTGGDTTPRVTSMVDKTTVATELGKVETVTVALASENGFAGDVTLDARLVDAADIALPGVSLEGPTTVSLAANGTATAEYKLTIPTNASGSDLTGNLKIDLTSSAGNASLSTAVTIAAVYTIDYPAGTGMVATDHPNAGLQNIVVKRGAILRFKNDDNITHIIHGDGVFPHEDTGNGGKPGRTYDIETIAMAPGSDGNLGCHSHGNASYARYVIQ